jgi:hypothetical protein
MGFTLIGCMDGFPIIAGLIFLKISTASLRPTLYSRRGKKGKVGTSESSILFRKN